MIEPTEQRYAFLTQILTSTPGFLLHYGEDLFLKREVFLYSLEIKEIVFGDAYVNKLRKASSLTHAGFLHILDTVFTENKILVVLKHKSGKPLIQVLNQTSWTFSQIVTLATELGVSMLDAMEEQITGFSVDTGNLWLSEDGRLSVINFWEDGAPQSQGAIGLCNLMIQLSSGSEQIQDPFEPFDTHLFQKGLLLAQSEQKEALMKLIRRVHQGQASLSTLIFGLQDLLQTDKPRTPGKIGETTIPLNSNIKKINLGIPLVNPSIMEPGKPAVISKKVIMIASSGLITVVIVIWLWSLSSQPNDNRAKPIESLSPTHLSTPHITQSPQPSTSVGSQGEANTEVIVPNLLGMTQADAEKQALNDGLRYSYVMETNQQAKGTVFKQEPASGTIALKGESVKFWVSKGSQ